MDGGAALTTAAETVGGAGGVKQSSAFQRSSVPIPAFPIQQQHSAAVPSLASASLRSPVWQAAGGRGC